MIVDAAQVGTVAMVLGGGKQMIEEVFSNESVRYFVYLFATGLLGTLLANFLSFVHGVRDGWEMILALCWGGFGVLFVFVSQVNYSDSNGTLTLLKFVLIFASLALGFFVGSYRFLIRRRKKGSSA